jgi:proteasome lid subunit RPN8/RPN11
MQIHIPHTLLKEIHSHGEQAYPEEGAGLMLGRADKDQRSVKKLLFLENAREESARRNRYSLTPQDILRGEEEAAQAGLDIIGIFHSHPDHPDQPSAFDLEWAIPWYSYLITSVYQGKAERSRSWRLLEDRSGFQEETIQYPPQS